MDYYIGYGGGPALTPGTYRLGSLIVRATSGTPRLSFASRSPWDDVQTSFGSMNPGKEGCNTLIYTEEPAAIARIDARGDWGDADGTAASAAFEAEKESALRFGVSVAPNPLNPDATLAVTTTRPGFLRVRIFDVHGRLARVLLDQEVAAAGQYPLRMNSGKHENSVASGIYFYSVEASEGRLNGRIVVLK